MRAALERTLLDGRKRRSIMQTQPRLIAVLALAALVSSCWTTTTYSTWSQASAAGDWARGGRLESIREMVRRREGNPAGGALAGALIGGFLFGGRGPGALIGAAGGAAVGAAASQGSSETRFYQVLVHFDDGTFGMFTYAAYPPFAPGQAVVLTRDGLWAATP
jgi:outer membrane lipoprotein SlyB